MPPRADGNCHTVESIGAEKRETICGGCWDGSRRTTTRSPIFAGRIRSQSKRKSSLDRKPSMSLYACTARPTSPPPPAGRIRPVLQSQQHPTVHRGMRKAPCITADQSRMQRATATAEAGHMPIICPVRRFVKSPAPLCTMNAKRGLCLPENGYVENPKCVIAKRKPPGNAVSVRFFYGGESGI